MKFEKGDLVVITVDHPFGVVNWDVIGNVGTISDISEDCYYEVTDEERNCFLYAENELREAKTSEIKGALRRLLLR